MGRTAEAGWRGSGVVGLTLNHEASAVISTTGYHLSFSTRHKHRSTTMDREDDYNWEFWKFGMIFDDHISLTTEYNTLPSPIQDSATFRKDFAEIARNSETREDFLLALSDHRRKQLCLWKGCLEQKVEEIALNHGRLPKMLWNTLLDLFSPILRVKPLDFQGWESPLSVQGIVELLTLCELRLVSTDPLAISYPTPKTPPSANPASPLPLNQVTTSYLSLS